MSFINMRYRSETSNKNKELQRAINERKCDEVKILLSTGADINHTVNQNLDTMLHTAKNSGIAYDLLGYSANIDAKNLYGKTPLHSAAECGKSAEFVRALLAHAPAVDAKDSNGNTPLNLAVERTDKNYETIRELVAAGAAVNDTKWDWKNDRNTPLDTAVLSDDTECAKALIKYRLMTFNSPTGQCINLSAYYRRDCYPMLLSFRGNCCLELDRMKRDIVVDKTRTTLHQVVWKKFLCRNELGEDENSVNELTEKCLDVVKNKSYPIYNDIMISKLKTKLQKNGLVNKLRTVQVFTRVEKGKVALNFDSAKALARFLPRNDLYNFVIAYFVQDPVKKFSNNINGKRDVDMMLGEPSTSGYSGAKHIKKV